MRILGVNEYGHDTSVCLVEDGKIVFAVEEERMTGKKHEAGFMKGGTFPEKSMNEILRRLNLKIQDIDLISFGWDLTKDKAIYNAYEQWKNFTNFNSNNPIKKEEIIKKRIVNFKKRQRYISNKFKNNKIEFIPHHLAHAASTYRCSNFSEALIVVLDGAGEEDWLSLYLGKGNKISKVKSFPIKNSLGNLYTYITTRIVGFSDFSEGKLMGLAAYGKVFDKEICSFDKKNEEIIINLNKIKKLNKHGSKSFSFSKINKDIAATIQFNTEKTILDIIEFYAKRYEQKNICLAGGVALNCLINGKLRNKKIVNEIYVPNFTNDTGASLGAALESYARRRKCYKLNITLSDFGFSYSLKEILDKIRKNKNYKITKLKNYSLIAKKLAENKIIALYQGRFEFGPRALGNRSILANPDNPLFKKKINKIKGRDFWRPFACMVLRNKLSEVVQAANFDAPFMNIALKAKSNKIIAVTHKDNTTRVQTVDKTNKIPFRILSEFYKLTKNPALLNTSFNFRGQPLISTPTDAFKFFDSVDYFDGLVLENYFIERN